MLDEEELLLSNNITPSPFFRFPGLVSDRRLLEKLKELSLVPVGADAWLAKGEEPHGGSIIPVHGNGNEPEGIKGLPTLFKKRRPDFQRGELKLLPLRDAFTGK